ncbi:MAG TPA: polysaccharide deacetylase family protein [Patescibacteria group bacterium]|nr:polysaccharide deacetylase family protein [Patescibacteria group bacterium]
MIILLLILAVAFLVYGLFFAPVSQLFGSFPYEIKQPATRCIALTFDDGPNEPYTTELADFLKQQGVKATFFQVGNCVQRFPEVTKRLVNDGHMIGNHSLSHKFTKYLTQPTFKDEITVAQHIFQEVLGKRPAFFRPPWLFHHPLLFQTVKQQKLRPVSGRFCYSFEVLQPSAKRIARRTLAKIKPGAIIIFHDGYDGKGGNRCQTIDAVKLVIPALKVQGYEFVTIDKLFDSKPYL